MDGSATTQAPVWLAPDAGDFAEFEALMARQTDPASVPFAAEVARNVPIYAGEMVRGIGDRRHDLMAEWARVLLHGPGIVVIKDALPDDAVIDRATAVFEGLIATEKAEGKGGGDHFAKPGANDRVWNAAEKHCLVDPEGFALYFGNAAISTVSEAWLGPGWQLTAQVNRVNPGGAAQTPHRDYHLGFMSAEAAAAFPAHVHALSPVLTLQGAVAHCDMPLESGPTLYLPYSQLFPEGYVAFGRPEFQTYFAENHVQLPLEKGDAVFFNPALMHGAGTNVSADIYRMANLLQVSSAFGRAIETVDRSRMARALYPVLQEMGRKGTLGPNEIDMVIAATAEGYAFPTNLDRDPPVGGLAPKSPQAQMREALAAGIEPAEFGALLDTLAERRESH